MNKSLMVLTTVVSIAVILGCAEGPLWQTGSYVPWVREKWEAEEQVADTLSKRKREMTNMVQDALNASADTQAIVVKKLAETIQRDPVLLVRIHAVELLGHIDNTESTNALALASQDPDSRVRTAAINTWKSKPASVAVGHLQEILGSDTDVDVRLEATDAIGKFNVPEAAIALTFALTDANPAVQLRATESLEKITGKRLGPDVAAWQSYLDNQSGQRTAAAESGNSVR